MIKKTEKKVKEKEVELKTPFVMIGGKTLQVDHVDDRGFSVYKIKSEGADWEFILCPKSSLEVVKLMRYDQPARAIDGVFLTNKLEESTVTTKHLKGFNTITRSKVELDNLNRSVITDSTVKNSSITESHVKESYVVDSVIHDSYVLSSELSSPNKWKVFKSYLSRINLLEMYDEEDSQGFEVTVIASSLKDVNISLRGYRNVIANASIRGADIFRRHVVVADFLEGGVNVLDIRSPFDVLNISVTKDTHLLMTRMTNGTFVVSFGGFGAMVKIDHGLLEKGRDAVRAAIEEIPWGRNHARRGEFGNSLIEHVVSMILSRIEVSKVVSTSAENLDYLGIRPGKYGYFNLEIDSVLDSVHGYGPSDIPF